MMYRRSRNDIDNDNGTWRKKKQKTTSNAIEHGKRVGSLYKFTFQAHSNDAADCNRTITSNQYGNYLLSVLVTYDAVLLARLFDTFNGYIPVWAFVFKHELAAS